MRLVVEISLSWEIGCRNQSLLEDGLHLPQESLISTTYLPKETDFYNLFPKTARFSGRFAPLVAIIATPAGLARLKVRQLLAPSLLYYKNLF